MADAKFKVGDRVRYTAATEGTNVRRNDGIGTVSDDPILLPFGWYVVTVRFDDGAVEQGIREVHLELVPLSPRAEMAGNANAGETPLPLRTARGGGRDHPYRSALVVGERVYIVSGPLGGDFGTISALHGDQSGTITTVTVRTQAGREVGPVAVTDLAREPRRDVPGMTSGVTEPILPLADQPPFILGSSELGSDDVLGDDPSTSDTPSNTRGTAPAADRIVSINHNSPEVQEVKASLDALIDGVRGDNHLTANADEKLAYISELQDLRRAMEGPTIRVRRMYDAVYSNGVIRWLCDKAGGTIVGTLATTAAAAILKWLGVL